jgi:elongation factor P
MASDIKTECIKYNNDIYKIIEFLHVKPEKGPFVRTKLRSLTNGKVLDIGHKIEEVRVENHKFQFYIQKE